MEITLRNLKHSPSLSEETYAFTATVVVDGLLAFEASNHGRGGPDFYHPVRGYTGPTVAEIDAWLAANTPKIEGEGYSLDNSLELVVGELIEAELARKRLNRLLGSKIVVLATDNGQPALFTYKAKPTPDALSAIRDRIAAGKIEGELVNGADEGVLARAQALI